MDTNTGGVATFADPVSVGPYGFDYEEIAQPIYLPGRTQFAMLLQKGSFQGTYMYLSVFDAKSLQLIKLIDLPPFDSSEAGTIFWDDVEHCVVIPVPPTLLLVDVISSHVKQGPACEAHTRGAYLPTTRAIAKVINDGQISKLSSIDISTWKETLTPISSTVPQYTKDARQKPIVDPRNNETLLYIAWNATCASYVRTDTKHFEEHVVKLHCELSSSRTAPTMDSDGTFYFISAGKSAGAFVVSKISPDGQTWTSYAFQAGMVGGMLALDW